MKKLILILLAILSVAGFAQLPVLETLNEKRDYKTNHDINLERLSIDVKVVGSISTTIMTMVFKSTSNRILEGRLTFPLPEGVTVSGYALDINGKLRDAVPVEKEKAKEVFESIERRRVDPGILEKVEGNNFRTRIYPIPANGTRKVQITYHQELNKQGSNLQYFLPLDYKRQIPYFQLKTTVYEKLITPQLEEKPDGNFTFKQKGNVWVAEIKKENYVSNGNLRINLPQQKDIPSVVMQNASGNQFYFIGNVDVTANAKAKKSPNKIEVIWDNSLSGKNRDHEKELELLDQYFKTLKKVTVEVSFLNIELEKGDSFEIINGDWQKLKDYLLKTKYDGGTDFGKLENISKADMYLLFSDGLSSFGDMKINFDKPVYTIVSSPKANFSQLRFISLKTGGELINLQQNLPITEVKKLLYDKLRFLGIKDNNGLSEVYPQLPQTVDGHFSIAGIISLPVKTITLLFGYGNNPTIEKTVELNASQQNVEDWDISQFWAQKKITELELFSDKNKNEIKNIGKQFGIVTRNTSLMVLESVQDYVRYEITPPTELLTEYNNITKNNQQQRQNRINNMMQRAESMVNDLKGWWNKDFSNVAKYPKPHRKKNDSTRHREIEEVVVMGYGVSNDEAPSGRKLSDMAAPARSIEALKDKKMKGGDYYENSGKITIVDVKSDEEYMKIFDGLASTEDIYEKYLTQREQYIQTTSYYFDIAKLLVNKGNKRLGLKVLSSVADLDLENEELYKLLAYKLKETEVYGKELWISGKVLEWRPMDPQSYRDYALALEDNGRYQEALDTLYKIFTQSYSAEFDSRISGIEETVLMEINELISNHKVSVSSINPKLIANMPVNIRVAINWNKDNTDIDLWVTDPRGEKCMYSHKSTDIGGRISADFTRGFGPEQFLLKKAVKGKYKIETNFFGETQASVSGPTTIMAEIFINYASGKQEKKIVVFNKNKKSTEGNGDGVLIAEFEF